MERGGDKTTPRPAHATVVAYLALFVALGGTATALKGTSKVRSDDIAAGAVTKTKIAKKAVNSLRLAPRSVTTSRLVPAAVTSKILAAGAVTADDIRDGAVTSNAIAAEAVGSGKIAKQAVGGAEIKSDAIGSGKLKDGAVEEAKLADGSVAEAKLKAGAVTGEKVKTGSLPLGKLSSSVVTAGAPLVAGLGRPALEFVQTAHLEAGAVSQPIASVAGVATLLASCNAGSEFAYRNDSAESQVAIIDPDETAPAAYTVAAGATSPAVGQASAVTHASVFALAATSGAAVSAETYGINAGAGGCDFYTWSLARA